MQLILLQKLHAERDDNIIIVQNENKIYERRSHLINYLDS